MRFKRAACGMTGRARASANNALASKSHPPRKYDRRSMFIDFLPVIAVDHSNCTQRPTLSRWLDAGVVHSPRD